MIEKAGKATGVGISSALRILMLSVVAVTIVFLINNYLIFWRGWTGLDILFAHLGWFGLDPRRSQ